MNDLKKYISDRKKRDKKFAKSYKQGYEQFKVGVILRNVAKDTFFSLTRISKVKRQR